jgi:hypothetical protein
MSLALGYGLSKKDLEKTWGVMYVDLLESVLFDAEAS